jgi:thiamine biosynthesis protein ThiI
VNAIVGASIQAKTQARVDLKKPERVFWVDVLKEEALVSTDQLKGFGGLPPGSSGRALVLFSGGIDSPVAAFLAMQRGLKVDLIHFSAFPYVRYVNEEKHRWLAQRLALFQGKTRLYRVGIGRVQQMIAAHTPKKLLVVLNRRLMLRLASEIGRRNGYGALITGDSLGQVASQTLENLTVIDHASPMMTLRPLIGLGKQAIVGLAKQIETFSLSIQPDEDCCQLFVPKHPETRANLEKVLSVESHLSLKDWEKEALDGLKHEEVFPPIKSVISSYEAFYLKKPSWLQGSVS